MSDQKTISAHVLTDSGYRAQKKGSQTLILNSVLINFNRFFFHYFFPGNSLIPWKGMPQLNHTACEEPATFPHPCSIPIATLAWKKALPKMSFPQLKSAHLFNPFLCCCSCSLSSFWHLLRAFSRATKAFWEGTTSTRHNIQAAGPKCKFLQWHCDDFCLVFYSLLNNP